MFCSHKANFAELGCGAKHSHNSIDFSISGYSRAPLPHFQSVDLCANGRTGCGYLGNENRRFRRDAESMVQRRELSPGKETIEVGEEVLKEVTSKSL